MLLGRSGGAGLAPDSLCWPSHGGTAGNKTGLVNTAMLNSNLDFRDFQFRGLNYTLDMSVLFIANIKRFHCHPVTHLKTWKKM